jgi:hypothetical protein
MINEQTLSWIISILGMSGFLLAGRKVWWCWYINIACQLFWFMYAIASNTPAFFVTAMFYSGIFSVNAWNWTREHFANKAQKGQYRTKSSPVDALYFKGGVENASEIMAWLGAREIQAWWKEPAESYVNSDGRYLKALPETIRILDREGTLDLCPGEYVVLGNNDRVYIYDGDAFESVYERDT